MKTYFLIVFLFLSYTFAQSNNLRVREWSWQKSTCLDCWILFKVSLEDSENKDLVEFINTIQESKFDIVNLYNSDPQEYNLLAHMALGILGNESSFFQNWRYKVKSQTQGAITAAKVVKKIDPIKLFTIGLFAPLELAEAYGKASPNSKGPTQIKNIPDKISSKYNIVETDLWIAKNAARATMGYLIEALAQLKRTTKNNNLSFITTEHYIDYLPYIYFGKSKMIREGSATPDKNIYVQNMKKHMQRFKVIEVY